MSTKNWRKIKTIVERALEMEAAERRAYIEKVCGGEPEIFEEVESLVSNQQLAEDFFSSPALFRFSEFFETERTGSMVGQTIGVYKIIREIGSGGMGAVFLAERADGKFEQKAALKLLKREMNTAAIRRRFEQEREILALLEHPNIARLIDAGMTDDGIPYLAMEYVEGLPIDVYITKNQLKLNERLNIFRRICEAVGFAHRNLIIHRDLKPSNIIVTADGVPKLLDFGISKILSQELEQVDTATVTRLGAMTPAYASPEQLRRESVTTATDIYSLGVILFELLSGYRPFQAQESDLNAIYRAVLETDPPLPSTLAKSARENYKERTQAETEVREIEPRQEENATSGGEFGNRTNPNFNIHTISGTDGIKPQQLKGDLDNIILKALKKEPERRYSSAENFAEDIKRFQTGLPVAARPDTFVYRTEKFVRRNLPAVAAVALIVLAILAGIGATLWQAGVARAERIKAEKRFNEVRSLANSFLFEITPQIEDLPGSTNAKRLLVSRALDYLNRLAPESSEDPVLQREIAAAYEKVGDVQGNPYEPNIGDTAGALDSYQKARAIRERLLQNEPENIELKADLAKNTQVIGDIKFFSGEIEKAAELYRQAVSDQQEINARNPSDTRSIYDLALARYALGATYFWNSDYEKALENYQAAKDSFEYLIRRDPSNTDYADKLANVLIRTGETYGWQNRLENAEEKIAEGLGRSAALVRQHPNNSRYRKTLWTAHLKLGEVYLDGNRLEKSLEQYREALRLAKTASEFDPVNAQAKRDLALSYNKVGDTLDSLGSGAEALAHARKALEIQEQIAAADPDNYEIRRQIAGTFKRMGYAQTTMKDHRAARESFEHALAQYKKLAETDPHDEKIPREIAIVTQTIGQTFHAAAQQGNRKENLRKALEWNRRSLELLLEMKAKGTLPEFDDRLINEIETEIGAIETKLGGS